MLCPKRFLILLCNFSLPPLHRCIKSRPFVCSAVKRLTFILLLLPAMWLRAKMVATGRLNSPSSLATLGQKSVMSEVRHCAQPIYFCKQHMNHCLLSIPHTIPSHGKLLDADHDRRTQCCIPTKALSCRHCLAIWAELRKMGPMLRKIRNHCDSITHQGPTQLEVPLPTVNKGCHNTRVTLYRCGLEARTNAIGR